MAASQAGKLSRARAELCNAQTAELLAREAEQSSGILVRAFRRAGRLAFLWPEDVLDLIAQNGPLTELAGIGPFIEKQIRRWIVMNRRRSGAKFHRFAATSSRWRMRATAPVRFTKWPKPPRAAVMNPSRSPIIRRD